MVAKCPLPNFFPILRSFVSISSSFKILKYPEYGFIKLIPNTGLSEMIESISSIELISFKRPNLVRNRGQSEITIVLIMQNIDILFHEVA